MPLTVAGEHSRVASPWPPFASVYCSDPTRPGVEYAEGGREGVLTCRVDRCQVQRDPAPRGGEGLGEAERAVELHAVLLLAPGRVIEVLAATGGSHPRRVDRSVGVGSNPNSVQAGVMPRFSIRARRCGAMMGFPPVSVHENPRPARDRRYATPDATLRRSRGIFLA